MENDPNGLEAFILFFISCVLIPLILAYRRGYSLNIRGKLSHWFIPSFKPSVLTATYVKRFSWFDKAQIESIKAFKDYHRGKIVAKIQIRWGKEIIFPMANEISLKMPFFTECSLDKNKIQ